MKIYGGVKVELCEFLTSVRFRYAPASLPLGKELWRPLDRRLGKLQSDFDAIKKRKVSTPLGDQTPIS